MWPSEMAAQQGVVLQRRVSMYHDLGPSVEVVQPQEPIVINGIE